MTRQEQLNEAWCKYRGKCSTEIIHALAFALRWCDEHPNWISVEDELPQYGTYIVATEGNVVEISLYDIDGWDNWRGGNVTHWMPMPAPVLSNSENTGKSSSVKLNNSTKGGKA